VEAIPGGAGCQAKTSPAGSQEPIKPSGFARSNSAAGCTAAGPVLETRARAHSSEATWSAPCRGAATRAAPSHGGGCRSARSNATWALRSQVLPGRRRARRPEAGALVGAGSHLTRHPHQGKGPCRSERSPRSGSGPWPEVRNPGHDKPDLFGENRCNRPFTWVTSSAGVAAEAQGRPSCRGPDDG
jgi:hypothetical protein